MWIKIRKIILTVVLYIVLVLWFIVCIIHTGLEPPTPDNFTVEERIRYESRVFPY